MPHPVRFSQIKRPALSAVAFFGTLGILSVGYSAYVSNYPATATAGVTQLSATEWNKMVTALQALDTNLSAFTFSGGNVWIGNVPNTKLSVNGSINAAGTVVAAVGPLQSVQPGPDIGGYVNLINTAKSAAGTANVWTITNMGGSYGNSLQFWKYDKTNPCSGGMCTAAFKIYDAGNAWLEGTLTQSSDERLKTGVAPIEWALGKVLSLSGVTYEWKNPNSSKWRQIGLIAQDVETQFPELVATDENGMKSVAYSNMVAPLIEAVKEQQRQIDELEARIRELENR